MLTFYRRQMYHDRRRIAFASVLTLFSGYFGNGVLPDPLPVSSETLMVTGLLAVIPLFTARLRAHRHWIEIIAIGNLVVTLCGPLFPTGAFGWHDAAFMLTLQIPAFVGLLLALNLLIYGPWSDRFAPRRRYLVETTLRSRLSLEDLWTGMVPTPGFADHNPDKEVVSIEFADATKSVVRLTTWVPPRAGTGEVLLDIQEIKALRHVRFRLRVTRGIRTPDAEGETEMVFEDRGRHRVLHLRHEVNGYTPRQAILGYFDDTFGRMMAARLTAIETRAATGQPTKTQCGFGSWFRNGGDLQEPSRDTEIGGYRTAYGRQRSADETKALQALGRH